MLTPSLTIAHPRRIHRIAVGSLFFLYGLCFATWASRIPSIQQKLSITDTSLGLILFSLPIGSFLSLPLSGWLTARLGSRKVVIVAAVFYSIALVMLGLAPSIIQLIGGLFLFGLAGNMLNISVNTQAVGVEAMYGRSIMASFHGLWSLAGFAGASIGSYMLGASILPYQHFLLIFGLAMIILLVSQRYILREDVNAGEGQPLFARPDKSLVTLGVIAFCSMICEGTMFDWSGVYFKKVVMAKEAWLGAGLTAFMSTMALGRFFADALTLRIGTKKILQLSGVLTASGLLLAVLFPNLVTAIIGFLFVGFGVSSVVPLVYSAAGRSKVMSPGVALAAVSTIGFLGFLSGPPLIGIIAGFTSLRISFTVIAMMGLFIAVMSGKLKLD
jgi:MFS family permease